MSSSFGLSFVGRFWNVLYQRFHCMRKSIESNQSSVIFHDAIHVMPHLVYLSRILSFNIHIL